MGLRRGEITRAPLALSLLGDKGPGVRGKSSLIDHQLKPRSFLVPKLPGLLI